MKSTGQPSLRSCRALPTRLVRWLNATLLLLALAAGACAAQEPTGTIAYLRGRSEIRAIAADGTADRLLWKHPQPDVAESSLGTTGLDWSPDGQELAFASGHEGMYSFLESDIYVMRADGTGIRRITNPPSYAAAQSMPYGKVVVTVQNDAVRGTVSGPFIVSIAGADKAQTMTVPRGESRTVTFDRVADLGEHLQPIIALYGMYRWATTGINVFAGQTIKAPPLVIMGQGLRNFGAYVPVWRPDGKEIGYTLDSSIGLYSISTSAPPGAGPGRELAGTGKTGAGGFDWGAANATNGSILYTGRIVPHDNTIYQASVDGAQRRKLVSADGEFDYMLGVHWLPDGSGFVYVQNNNAASSSNVFRYDFATGRSTQLTKVQGRHIVSFDVSPDGKWIVYGQRTELWPPQFGKDPSDLWIARIDGSGQRLLVKDATAPSWRRQ